jgi:hypothetical protein
LTTEGSGECDRLAGSAREERGAAFDADHPMIRRALDPRDFVPWRFLNAA